MDKIVHLKLAGQSEQNYLDLADQHDPMLGKLFRRYQEFVSYTGQSELPEPVINLVFQASWRAYASFFPFSSANRHEALMDALAALIRSNWSCWPNGKKTGITQVERTVSLVDFLCTAELLSFLRDNQNFSQLQQELRYADAYQSLCDNSSQEASK